MLVLNKQGAKGLLYKQKLAKLARSLGHGEAITSMGLLSDT